MTDVTTSETQQACTGSFQRIAGLDGLRGMACLAVFGSCLQQMTGVRGVPRTIGPIDLQRLLENGNTGVCLFFVLSGAVLSLPLWQKDFPQVSTRWLIGYAGRRLVRIVPAYYVCVIALVLLGYHWCSLGEVLDTLLHLSFLHNLREETIYSIAFPFWTIGVQMQFYVLLPLIFCILSWCSAVWPRRELLLLLLVIGSYLVHFLLMEHGLALDTCLGWPGFFRQRPTVFSHSVLAHLPHLLLGVLAGRYLADRNWPRESPTHNCHRAWDAMAWGTLLSIGLILGSRLHDLFQIPHGRYHFPFIPSLVALLVVCTPHSPTAKWILDKTRLCQLGTISFGVYVYHYPLMRLIAHGMDKLALPVTTYWPFFAVASLSITVLVSWVSFRFLEEPLLRRMSPAK